MSTTFNFNLGSKKEFDFEDFYGELCRMAECYQEGEKPTLFFGSHDMARFPSRFDFNDLQVKGLLLFLMSYDGIPFLYFGDEIGMRNLTYKTVEDARDVQGILAYERTLKAGGTKEEAMEVLNRESRDKSRNTMQWDASIYGGFSRQTPWISSDSGYLTRNVEQSKRNPESILAFTKKMIALRKSRKELSYGICMIKNPLDHVFYYVREYEEMRSLAIGNTSDEVREVFFKEYQLGRMLIATCSGVCRTEENSIRLPGYAFAIFQIDRMVDEKAYDKADVR